MIAPRNREKFRLQQHQVAKTSVAAPIVIGHQGYRRAHIRLAEFSPGSALLHALR